MTYKILYVTQTCEIGGAENSLLSLASMIDLQYFYPIVILPDDKGPFIKKLKEHNIKTVVMPLNRLRWRNPFPYLKTVFNLMQFIRKNNIDIAHSNIRFTNQYLVPAAKLARIPVVSHVRALLSREWFLEFFFWMSDTLISNSYATEKKYLSYLRKSQKSFVIHNGINLDWFVPFKKKNELRKQLGIDENKFLIGVVASIVPQKGQKWFLEVFKKVVDICPHAFAVFVGDTKLDNTNWYLEELEKKVTELGLENSVKFAGFIKDVVSVYDSLDLLVLPSDTSILEESFGRVLIEAMAMKKPVIATAGGGVLEIIDNGKTGFLVPFNDTNAMVNAMLNIIKDPELSKKFGEDGRRKVEEKFDIKLHVKKIEQLYFSILENKI